MKQTGINDGVEREAEARERERVDEAKIDPDSALERLAPRLGDGGLRCINRTDIVSQTREIERVVSSSAADIEHGANNRPRLGQADNGRLRSADLPWGCVAGGLIESSVRARGQFCRHGVTPSRVFC